MKKLNGNKWAVQILSFILFAVMLECGEKPQVKQELNLLCWIGYEERAIRRLPINQPEKVWQDAWQEFKTGKQKR